MGKLKQASLVFAGLAGPNRGQGVPKVGHGDDYAVDVLVVEHAATVRQAGTAGLECMGGAVILADLFDNLGPELLFRLR